MSEDPADDGRLLDERDQPQAATTPGASQHVKPERAFHQGCPRSCRGLNLCELCELCVQILCVSVSQWFFWFSDAE